MKTVLALLAFLIPASAWAFSTVEEFQEDFEQARECEPIEGRKVWAGKDAYYIQAWFFQTGQSSILDEETASAVPIEDNDAEALADFIEACK